MVLFLGQQIGVLAPEGGKAVENAGNAETVETAGNTCRIKVIDASDDDVQSIQIEITESGEETVTDGVRPGGR